MDDHRLKNLTQETVVIVPTQSLAAHLKEQIADTRVAQGQSVWEAPNIFVWREYLHILWQHNRDRVSQSSGAHSVISERQSSLLWTQVIESTKQQESSLTLLDVQQTVRVVQRSWRLMHDWRVQPERLLEHPVADTKQFSYWIEKYQALLARRGFMDDMQLQNSLIEVDAATPFSSIIWFSYDLVTAAQRALSEIAEKSGCEQHKVAPQERSPETKTQDQFLLYTDSEAEIRATCQAARQLIEQDPKHKINIVIPDLHLRYAAIQEISREVFYPNESPLEVQLGANVYRFSLGQPFNHWPAIEAALGILRLLNNRVSVSDLCYLFRNQFVGVYRNFGEQCRLFERWLTGQRIQQITVDKLPKLYQQCLDYLSVRQQLPAAVDLLDELQRISDLRRVVSDKLSREKNQNGYAALDFEEWTEIFDQWLRAWGWQASLGDEPLNSVQYQLHKRWTKLLEEFSRLALVQKRIGLRRALDILSAMARESIFQPQAVASPILISGVFEAIGRPVDSCFLLSMDQDYPRPPQADAFISNRILRLQGFPDASPETSFGQAEQLTANVLASAQNRIISYAKQHPRDREIDNQVSPLFRKQKFEPVPQSRTVSELIQLDQYVDTTGPAWPAAISVTGGTKLFENQSLCAFRGFVTYRLGFQSADEAEFGLDSLDRGIIVHKLLDSVWAELQTQQKLLELGEAELQEFVTRQVSEVCSDPELGLTEDKRTLLHYEQPRLSSLLVHWLDLEKKRPVGFSVVEREEKRMGEIGGVQFQYAIDRLDLTDDGRSLIIDYKTGFANRKDWQGKRLKSPQLPIYALALDKVKASNVDGISFAKVQQIKPEFVELAEAGILRSENSYTKNYQTDWYENRQLWPELIKQLASDFLNGAATVNPIDQKTCNYCELHAVCRISQLRAQSGAPLPTLEDSDE